MWWLALPPLIYLGYKVFEELIGGSSEENSSSSPTSCRPSSAGSPHRDLVALPTKGNFTGECVLVIGRTGAGKSSLINMLKREDVLPTGTTGSTTRCLHGIPVELGSRTMTFVDSPGIGEVGTDVGYTNGIKRWYSHNRDKIKGVVLVLQADSKAYADEKKLISSLLSISSKPTLIALNHADKMKPVRGSLKERAKNIKKKIRLVAEQFDPIYSDKDIVPTVAEAGFEFNRDAIIKAIRELYDSTP